MVRTLVLLSIALLMLLSGCESNGNNNPPTESESIREVNEAIQQFASGLSTEDLERAGEFTGSLFLLQPELEECFDVGEFNGRGRQAFTQYFERVIEAHGDIILIVTVQSIDIDRNIAIANVHVDFTAQRTDVTPPIPVHCEFDGIMTFEFKGGIWRLINFGLNQNGHNEGFGGNV
jgi:hypothetical protein